MHTFNDPLVMPKTGESPEMIYRRSVALPNTPGAAYLERRGIPVEVAEEAGVRFCENFGGRAAVLVLLRDQKNSITSIHGRYLSSVRGQNKMLTVGPGDGIISVRGGWEKKPLILVEGLFDALSLACCGWASCATIGRSVSWLPDVSKNNTVWLAFDASQSAEADVLRYRSFLRGTKVKRILPPARCLDWNTALKKRGAPFLKHWIYDQLGGE